MAQQGHKDEKCERGIKRLNVSHDPPWESSGCDGSNNFKANSQRGSEGFAMLGLLSLYTGRSRMRSRIAASMVRNRSSEIDPKSVENCCCDRPSGSPSGSGTKSRIEK